MHPNNNIYICYVNYNAPSNDFIFIGYNMIRLYSIMNLDDLTHWLYDSIVIHPNDNMKHNTS